MASIADVYVTVLPETSRVAADIKKAFAEVDKDARDAGKRWGKEIKDAIGPIKPEVKPETVSAKTELEKFRREEERKKIRQKIEFDEGDFKKKMQLIGKEFDGVGGKLASAGKWNLGLAGIGLIAPASTAIANLAGTVQQLAGAGLAIPGIFAGIASSMGTAALGFHGMSTAVDAFNAASLKPTAANVAALDKAMAALSPNAAETTKTFLGLKGTFTDLQHLDSQNLFAGVSGGLKDLVGNLLPTATRGIDGISRSLNQNLLQAMNSLGSGSSQGFLSRIFGNTASAQGNLSAAIDPIVHAVGTLAAAGSDSLPRLATAVGNVADRFNKFITAADGDGRLQKWISQGIDGFTSLGNIALNIGKSFTAITQAAGGGGGLLSMLESATQKLQLFLNSSAGQQTLIGFFAQGRDMLGQLKDIAVELGPILSGVFQAGLGSANLWLPVIRESLGIINSIPGGAQAVVTAFVAWKTISGVSSLLNSLSSVATMLKITLPAAAAEGGAAAAAGMAPLIAAIGAAVLAGKGLADMLVNTNRDHYFNADGSLKGSGDQWIVDHLGPVGRFLEPSGARPSPGGSPAANVANNPFTGLPAAQSNAPANSRDSGGVPAPLAGISSRDSGQTPQQIVDEVNRRIAASQSAFASPAAPVVSSYVPPVAVPKASSGGSTPNLPYTGTADPNAYGGTPVYTGGTTSDTHGELVPNAANLKTVIQQQFGITDIGGYRAPDGYNEHSSGQALDIMVGANKALGDQVNQFLLKNAAALGIQYDLWQQTQWNPDGTSSGMSDRGSPTANHRDHVHARVRPGAPASGAIAPMDSMYSGMDTGGVTSSDLSLRNAQQRINDTQHTEEQAQGRLNELRAKGTATDRQMEAAEYALAKAKREHQDAIDGLTVAQDKYNKSATTGKGGSNTDAQALGSGLLSGVGQIFGLDGSLFQDPSQFGLFKIFKAAMGLKFDPSKAAPGAGQGGSNYGAGMPSGGGGGGGLGGLLSAIPQAFGPLQVGSPQAAPGGFMPGMPGGGGGGTLLDAVQFSPTGQPGSPGPGNNPVGYQNAGIDLRGASFGDSQGQLGQQISAINSSQNRYGPMLQNVPT